MKALQRLILATLLCMATLHTQAAPLFASVDGSLIWDQATNLVWQRCSVGQTWDGNTCTGTPKRFTFDQAQNQTGNGWRVPTIRELVSLIYCIDGEKDLNFMVDLGDGGPSIPRNCYRPNKVQAINQVAFPAIPIYSSPPPQPVCMLTWSSSLYKDPRGAWGVRFCNGWPDFINRDSDRILRLVRVSQPSSSESALNFPVNIDEIIRQEQAKLQEEQRIADAKRQAEQRIADAKRQEEQRIADAKRQEEERRARAQRATAERSLLAGGVQTLYLQAGRAQRNGSIEQGGVSFTATELYEMIVEKFPKSEFAVKATDQLTAMGRSENQSRAAREAADAQRRADSNASSRAACFSRVRRCEANCSTWTVPSVCIRDCQESCN